MVFFTQLVYLETSSNMPGSSAREQSPPEEAMPEINTLNYETKTVLISFVMKNRV